MSGYCDWSTWCKANNRDNSQTSNLWCARENFQANERNEEKKYIWIRITNKHQNQVTTFHISDEARSDLTFLIFKNSTTPGCRICIQQWDKIRGKVPIIKNLNTLFECHGARKWPRHLYYYEGLSSETVSRETVSCKVVAYCPQTAYYHWVLTQIIPWHHILNFSNNTRISVKTKCISFHIRKQSKSSTLGAHRSMPRLLPAEEQPQQ